MIDRRLEGVGEALRQVRNRPKPECLATQEGHRSEQAPVTRKPEGRIGPGEVGEGPRYRLVCLPGASQPTPMILAPAAN